MKIQRLLAVLSLLVAAYPATAATYYVGTCHPNSFTTISAAVSDVAAGSVIDVCPGEYDEQVIISKSLTLQGAPNLNNANQPLVVGVSTGSTAQSQVLGLDLLPTIWVTAGTVNISDLAVGAVGSDTSGCPLFWTAIFYASGSSGTVKNVYGSGAGNGCGVGIWAENANTEGTSVTIENSIIAADDFAILAASQQPEDIEPVLENTITGNQIIQSQHGIYLLQSRGKVSGNNIVNDGTYTQESVYGIYQAAPSTVITENTLSNVGTGVSIAAPFATVTNNKIFHLYIGIDLGCLLSSNVSTNFIQSKYGLFNVPATYSKKNTFDISTLTGGSC
jgi:parallel beta-helix repeat protein